MLNSPYRGVWECVVRVYRAEGVRAFYRSYGTQVAMNVPFQALHVATYEVCARALNPSRAYDPSSHAVAGAAAGGLAAAATTPLDVCKTVLNTQAARADSLRDAAAAVWRAHRAPGFLRGVSARVLYQMPAAAICWLTYETFKHALGDDPPTSSSPSASSSPPSPSPPPPPPLAAALRLAAASTDVPATTLTRT